MFSEELEKIDWEKITKAIYSKTEHDVLRALGKEHCDVDDFMALISPAAAKYLEPMAQLSKRYTEERFGKTISMFIPLYITNSCTNSCVYCGFHISNPMARTILTPEQIEDEYKAIKRLGPFENLLLVTGENPAKAGVPYLAKALDIAKKYFSNLKIEVMPLKAEEYAELKEHGLNGVICFQETYNKARYNIYHPRGMKSKFEWRVNSFDRMGQAGVHSIGMGVLIGLEEWRTDVTMMAYHLRYLQKKYWKTKYSVNFPRMRRHEDGRVARDVAGLLRGSLTAHETAEAPEIDVLSTYLGCTNPLQQRLDDTCDHFTLQTRLSGNLLDDLCFCHKCCILMFVIFAKIAIFSSTGNSVSPFFPGCISNSTQE